MLTGSYLRLIHCWYFFFFISRFFWVGNWPVGSCAYFNVDIFPFFHIKIFLGRKVTGPDLQLFQCLYYYFFSYQVFLGRKLTGLDLLLLQCWYFSFYHITIFLCRKLTGLDLRLLQCWYFSLFSYQDLFVSKVDRSGPAITSVLIFFLLFISKFFWIGSWQVRNYDYFNVYIFSFYISRFFGSEVDRSGPALTSVLIFFLFIISRIF